MKRMTILLVALALAAPAYAGDDLYSADFASCMDASGGVTVEMMDCIGAEIAMQDAGLNATYKTVRAQLGPARKEQLVTAQRAWVQYRDANCAFYADPDGGTAAGVAANDCVLRETAERAAELRNMMPVQ